MTINWGTPEGVEAYLAAFLGAWALALVSIAAEALRNRLRAQRPRLRIVRPEQHGVSLLHADGRLPHGIAGAKRERRSPLRVVHPVHPPADRDAG